MDCREVIRNRRSIRRYLGRPVKKEDLELIISAACLAPSATNRQPWRFVLITGGPVKEQLAGAVPQPFVLKAPALFVCCLDRRAYLAESVKNRMAELVKAGAIAKEAASYITAMKMPLTAEEVKLPKAAYIDLGIAVQNMVIQAAALGLGSCWVRLFDHNRFAEVLNLPSEIEVVALLPLGYPDEEPAQRPRLSKDEILIGTFE